MFKKVLLILIIFILIHDLVVFAEMPKAYGDEKEIWEYLSEHSPSDTITAGIMGYFFRESRLKSNAVAGWGDRNLNLKKDICETFTKQIDNGIKDGSTKEMFIELISKTYGGYGLGQWYSINYLEHLYDLAQEENRSISNVELQCKFVIESLQKNEELWEELLECDTAIQCGRRIGMKYDCTDEEGAEAIAGFALLYYEKFHGGEK